VAYTFKHGDRPIEGITIQRAVGRGGFGEVYYALSDSGKQLAVKYLRENPEVELRGIAQVMNLKSPHLITIYDVRHNEDGEPFVIMEYVSGPSLRELLVADPDGLGPQKAAFFIKGIAHGLSYLHERGIVHRDLKPGNIFYDDGYVKIGDYGLSKHIAVSAHSGNTISVGTVHYMAPEIGSGSYTKSIDIYALGVMLYEMLTGRLPFTGSSMGEVLMRHLSDQPDLTGLPEPFASVIGKALAKEPRDRYQDTDEMVEALTSATEVSDSLASFDASVLAQTPRVEHPVDADRTVTTPPKAPAVPAMDAREPIDLPPIPPIPAVLGPKAAKRARKLQQKAQKIQQRAERKARAMHAKLADMGLGPEPRVVAEAARPGGRKRWQQFVIALIVLFAVAGGLGIIRGDGAVFGTSLLFLALGTLGTLLAYKLSARRSAIEYDFQDRLLYAACGFVFMLPAFAAGHEVRYWSPAYGHWIGSGFQMLIVPLTATLLLFNWNERIQMGRRRMISGGTVFWHALVALMIAGPLTDGRFVWEAAALAAGFLVLVQSVAGIWPLPTPAMPHAAAAPIREPRRQRVWEHIEGAYEGLSTAVEGFGARLERLGERGAKKAEGNQAARVQVDEASEAPAKPDAVARAPAAAQPAMAQAHQPSFVGRTANAGLAFLAKLLLLVGLTAALLFSSELIDFDEGSTRVVIGQGRVVVADRYGPGLNQEIPRAAVFAPLMLGTVLLVVSRRNDGAAHFLRGFFGCGFALAAAVLAMGPAAAALGAFLSDGCVAGHNADPLIQAGLLLAFSFVLLFWPKRRQPGTIVV
jgi:hypothetical protein